MGFPLLLFFKSTFSLVYDVSCLYVWVDSMYMMCLALDKLMPSCEASFINYQSPISLLWNQCYDTRIVLPSYEPVQVYQYPIEKLSRHYHVFVHLPLSVNGTFFSFAVMNLCLEGQL